MTAPPPRPTPTRPMPTPGPASAAVRPPVAPSRSYEIKKGRQVGAQRLVVYGPGGVGKTALCSLLPKVVFLDIEQGSRSFDVARFDDVETFADVRAVLSSLQLGPGSTLVIDTATKLEELALAETLANVPHEKPGTRITGIESYGFGKGYRHLYDRFGLVLQDSDRLIRQGINVALICHSCTADAPNPSGENYLRYEPRLQAPKKENNIRERVLGWADHVLFIGYDVASEGGKGIGSGTRTIYTQELPSHLAKTRGAFNPADEVPMSMPYHKGDDSIWRLLLGGAS